MSASVFNDFWAFFGTQVSWVNGHQMYHFRLDVVTEKLLTEKIGSRCFLCVPCVDGGEKLASTNR